MSVTATTIGILITLLGVWGLLQPQPLLALVDKVWTRQSGVYLAVIIRLLFGVALLAAASESRFPVFISGLGIFVVIAALLVPLLGMTRIRGLVDWWKARPAWAIRAWAGVAALFGAFIVYAMI